MKELILAIALVIIIAWLFWLLFLFNGEFPNMGFVNSAACFYLGKEIIKMFYKK